MFEVGKDYKISLIEACEGEWSDVSGVWTVAEVDGTLIKLTNPFSKDRIVNTASWHFVSAELQGERKDTGLPILEINELDKRT